MGPITFIAPRPTSPVDVQTAEPTLGDTSNKETPLKTHTSLRYATPVGILLMQRV